MIHVAIVEDEPSIRESLVIFLNRHASLEVANASASVEDLLEFAKQPAGAQVRVILLDIGLPGMTGLQGIPLIREAMPEADIVMLTTYDDSDRIFKALCAGAKGYLSKRSSLAEIATAILTVEAGGSSMSPTIARKVVEHFSPSQPSSEASALSPRQLQIVQGIVDGLSYKLIADRYMISINTVRDHIKKIYAILEVNSKAELIRKSMNGEV